MTRPKLPQTTSALAQGALGRLADVLELAQQETISLDHPAITAFGDAVARYVRSRDLPSPGRSAASWVREQLKNAMVSDVTIAGRPVAQALTRAAGAGLTRIASSVPAEDRGFTEAEVADRLAIPLGELEGMLRTRVGRKALGFPMHIGGGQFRWMRPWLMDPAVQAARSAGAEPPHLAPLPAEYEGLSDAHGSAE